MKSNERLKLLRSSLKKTQTEMAESLYTEQSTYSRWETGRTEMPLHVIHAICEKYKINSSEFLGLPDDTDNAAKDDNANKTLLQSIYTFPKDLRDKMLEVINNAIKFGEKKKPG